MPFAPSGFYLHASGLKLVCIYMIKMKKKGDYLPVCIRPLMIQWPVLKEASRNPYYFSEYWSLSQEEKTN